MILLLGPGVWHRLGASGASHGGLGGAGACDGFVTCRLKRNLPYGSVYIPAAFGSGGTGSMSGSGEFSSSSTNQFPISFQDLSLVLNGYGFHVVNEKSLHVFMSHLLTVINFIAVGGGILEMNILHTLTVDGYIKANSENVQGVSNWYSASGGSGGSIHIITVNYTGM